MSQLSFTFTTSSKVKTAHLVGTWDGYKGQLPLTSQGSGRWKGTFRFSEKTLKPGSRYWYYVSHAYPPPATSYQYQQRHRLTIINSTSKTAISPPTINQPALKSSPVPAATSTSSTFPNQAPPPSPRLPLPSPLSANVAPPTHRTQAAPSLPRRLCIPSQLSRTNPVAYARQTIQLLPASTIWPNTSRSLHSTRCAMSLHPHPLDQACRHAAQTARRHRHCRVSAIQAPQIRNVNANATASPVAVAASRLTAVVNVADILTTAHLPAVPLILRVRVRARKSPRRGDQEGKSLSLLRIMRASQDTWRRSLGIRRLNRESTLLLARAEGREDRFVVGLFGMFSFEGRVMVEHIHCFLESLLPYLGWSWVTTSADTAAYTDVCL